MARKPTRFWHPAKRLVLEATEKARALVAKRDTEAKLEDVRPRLQHYLRAMYGEGVTLESLAPPKKANLATRVLHNMALMKKHGASESAAQIIRLPNTLPTQSTGVSPLEQYRVMAVQHAERIKRATANHAREVTSDLERDLYQLAEAATVDAQIAASQPGLRAALEAARAESVDQRPRARFRTAIEYHVEDMIRHAWPNATGGPMESGLPRTGVGESNIPHNNDAESNATWARRMAVELEVKFGRKAAQKYRRAPEITLWQTAIRTTLPDEHQIALETETRQIKKDPNEPDWAAYTRSPISGGIQRGSSGGSKTSAANQSASGNQSSNEGTGGKAEGGEENESSPDGDNGNSPDKRTPNQNSKRNPKQQGNDTSNSSNHQQSDSGNTEAAQTGNTSGGGTTSGIAHSDQIVDDTMLADGTTYRYPEWDFNVQNFNAAGTIVRVMPPAIGSSEWATTALQQHARESHLAKRQFERLRSHRLRLRRQEQGDELDIEACVEAMVDRRMHMAPSDRLYSHVRPGRRDLAITLLIDVSGSTGEVVSGQDRVIDIERIAALVATSAFDALGDDYSILAFSSAGASNVRVRTLKEFGENNSTLVLQRISALEPHGTTRLGSAVRHATAMLGNHPAPHRLLLILSDGKPHDLDWYFVDYAIQDSRQAVMNARLEGIHPFCITVDATEGETYLTEIFGSAGYRVVSKPSQLSQALLQAVQRMLGK